jgi:RNA polymerase sigma-70 factor (TIGR02954 family)
MEPQEMIKLALAARDGDAGAFTELVRAHKLQLYKIAYSYLHNESDALEALQEVTCRAYTRISRLKEPQYISTWLIRIMIHYCIDERKRRERRGWFSAPSPADFWNEASGTGQVEDSEGRRLERIMMKAAVEELEEPYQSVILLKYYHDLTVAEVARAMEKPEGTIKTWLNKALKGLRSRLEKEGDCHE